MNYETLIKTVRGTVTTQMNPEYDSVRQDLIWNGRKPYRYPEIIIKAKDAADVQAAVKFAASTGRRVHRQMAQRQKTLQIARQRRLLDVKFVADLDSGDAVT